MMGKFISNRDYPLYEYGVAASVGAGIAIFVAGTENLQVTTRRACGASSAGRRIRSACRTVNPKHPTRSVKCDALQEAQSMLPVKKVLWVLDWFEFVLRPSGGWF